MIVLRLIYTVRPLLENVLIIFSLLMAKKVKFYASLYIDVELYI